MKFCPNCGTSTEGAGKFCTQCGFKLTVDAPVQEPVAPPVQEYVAPVAPVMQEPAAPVAPPVPQYAPPVPVQEPVAPPAPQYAPPAPVQEPVAPPAPQYAPPAPVQEPVAPPAPQYAPPAPVQEPVAPSVPQYAPPAPVQEPVAPPAPQYAPPAPMQNPTTPPAPPYQNFAPQPGYAPQPPYGYPQQNFAPQTPAKPAKKSNLPLFIGIGVAVVLIILAFIFVPMLFGGNSVEGIYEGVSISMMGMEFSGDSLAEMGATQMELKAEGKCTMTLMDDTVEGTWKQDGEKITFELDGITAAGTLKDGKLTLTVSEEGMEMVLVFQKKDAPKTDKGGKETKPAPTPIGQYQMTTLSMMGTTLSGSDLASAGESWLKLDDGGSCTLMLMDDKIAGTYTISGSNLSFDLEGIAGTGVWDADSEQIELTVTDEGLEMVMTFSKGGTTQSGSSEISNADWWEGDWYGWWIVSDGDGFYKDYIDDYWDAAATIEVSGKGGTITIWDEDTAKNDPLAEVTFEFTDGFGDHGAIVSTDGTFNGVDVQYYDWLIDSDGDAASTFENMICIEGTCIDEDGEYFDYYIFLRPWGTKWEDVQNGNTSECPYEDMMPGLYWDWYLPLVESGVTSVPNSFD